MRCVQELSSKKMVEFYNAIMTICDCCEIPEDMFDCFREEVMDLIEEFYLGL